MNCIDPSGSVHACVDGAVGGFINDLEGSGVSNAQQVNRVAPRVRPAAWIAFLLLTM